MVADTGPLNYLVRLGLENTLPAIYREIVTPAAVLAELRHPRAPVQVREWAASPPFWLKRVPVQRVDETLGAELGAGEREAISLALTLRANVLLMDEAAGREHAKMRNLVVAGTLAVLLQGARRGMLDLPDTMKELRRLGFRFTATIEESVLDEYRRDMDG